MSVLKVLGLYFQNQWGTAFLNILFFPHGRNDY